MRKYHRTFETLLLILLCTQGSRSALATSSHSRKSSVRSWTWNASCRRTWGEPGSTGAGSWGASSALRAPSLCGHSPRRRTPTTTTLTLCCMRCLVVVAGSLNAMTRQVLTLDLRCLYSYWWLTPWTFKQWLSREHLCVKDFSQWWHRYGRTPAIEDG